MLSRCINFTIKVQCISKLDILEQSFLKVAYHRVQYDLVLDQCARFPFFHCSKPSRTDLRVANWSIRRNHHQNHMFLRGNISWNWENSLFIPPSISSSQWSQFFRLPTSRHYVRPSVRPAVRSSVFSRLRTSSQHHQLTHSINQPPTHPSQWFTHSLNQPTTHPPITIIYSLNQPTTQRSQSIKSSLVFCSFTFCARRVISVF